jgi:hypothetical protein
MPTYRAFWNAYFDEMIDTLEKEDFLSRIQVCIDFDQNYSFARDDLLHWPGRMLIIEADNDSYVPLEEREALRRSILRHRFTRFMTPRTLPGQLKWKNSSPCISD